MTNLRQIIVSTVLLLGASSCWLLAMLPYLGQSLFTWEPQLTITTIICFLIAPGALLLLSFLIVRFPKWWNFVILGVVSIPLLFYASFPFLEELNPGALFGRYALTPLWFRVLVVAILSIPLLSLIFGLCFTILRPKRPSDS